ncbi:MAG: hypothetical protein ACTHNP_12305 [Solirubrobacterales bacterium]
MSDAGPLIVPLTVEALVVNKHVRGAVSFLRAEMGYGQLMSGGNAQAGLNTADSQFNKEEEVYGVPAPLYYDGVYLKWRLPRALSWGTQETAKENLHFPPIPNRWIVARYAAVGGTPSVWLIESDYVWGPDGPDFKTVADASAYLMVEPEDKPPQPSYVGRRFDLAKETWSEPGTSLGLTALGAGNPAFAAYQPHNNNVLSFVDVLGEADAETFSYQVFGWFAKASEDPLGTVAAADFAKELAALGWELPAGTEPGLTASATVLAGCVDGVRWQTALQPDGGAPNGRPLSIATGNSSVEALTGLVAAQAAKAGESIEPELLEAFQLDALALLDEPDGEARLAERLHDSLFQRYAGGHSWEIVDAPGEEPPEEPELKLEAAWLLKLNEAQAALDAQLGELAALRLHLYELWWKYFSWRHRYSRNEVDGRNGQPPLTEADLREELKPSTTGSVAAQVRKKLEEVEASAKLVPQGATKEDLDAAIELYEKQHSLPKSRQLKRAESRSYHTPNNPVVLIAGAGASGIVPHEKTVQCRFPRQLVSGFQFDGKKVTAATVAVPQPNLKPVTGGPAWLGGLAEALAGEAFFTNLGNAAAIAAALGGADATAVRQAMEKAPTGTVPGAAVTTWKQNPWHPLLLIWSVEYFPIPLESGCENWVFEAGRYVWNGEGASPAKQTMGGTIQLGTSATFNMAGRLKAFLKSDPHLGQPEKEELEKLLGFLSNPERSSDWDLLSQALDGFNEGLLLGAIGLFASPAAGASALPALPDLIGPAPGYPPVTAEYAPPSTPLPPSEFLPLRGGQFWFTELALVDEWGQALIPITPQSSRDEIVFLPAEMTPGVSSSSVRFPVEAQTGAEREPERTPAAGTSPRASGSGITITKLIPSSAPAGSQELTLEVVGSGFEATASPVVTWNGLPLVTQFLGSTKLSATVPAEYLALPDSVAVAVQMERRVRTGQATLAQIPPAIPQPARLDFELLDAGDDTVVVGPLAPEANPICGWLLPNHLDASLMVYMPGGEALGEMANGIGATATPELLWRPAPQAPYSTLPEIEVKVPHLGPMLGALSKQGPTVFAAFLAAVDETLWNTVPAGAVFGAGLATLIGSPLAVVRARAGLDLLSGPRRDPSWRYTFAPQPDALGGCRLAVELGGRAWLDDGLIGYFEAEEYDRLFVVAQAEAAAGNYLHTIGEDGNHLSLPADGSAATHLTLLVDPRAPVHASTPVLPGASLALPPRLVEAALERLEVTFRLEGVLTGSETAPGPHGETVETIRLPLPAVNAGRWSWAELDAAGWTSYPVAATDATAALGDVPPALRRGLLRLSEFAKHKPPKRETK